MPIGAVADQARAVQRQQRGWSSVQGYCERLLQSAVPRLPSGKEDDRFGVWCPSDDEVNLCLRRKAARLSSRRGNDEDLLFSLIQTYIGNPAPVRGIAWRKIPPWISSEPLGCATRFRNDPKVATRLEYDLVFMAIGIAHESRRRNRTRCDRQHKEKRPDCNSGAHA